jgi:hypothetical protein
MHLAAIQDASVAAAPQRPLPGYVREQGPGEIVKRLKAMPPLERRGAIEQTYLGKKVLWEGEVMAVYVYADRFSVSVQHEDFFTVTLMFGLADRDVVAHIVEKAPIRYRATIKEFETFGATVDTVEVLSAGS